MEPSDYDYDGPPRPDVGGELMGEEWWKGHNGDERYLCVGTGNKYWLKEMPEELIDRIITDHNAAARLHEAEAALLRYGDHDDECQYMKNGYGEYIQPCTCGFASLFVSQPSEEGHER